MKLHDDENRTTMFVSGSNTSNQLGKKFETSNDNPITGEAYDLPLRIKDIKCGGMFSIILTQDNSLYIAGRHTIYTDDDNGQVEEFKKINWNGPEIQQVEVGGYYAMLLCGMCVLVY
jgi:alpha-tubulin suppressor-like RCC1 family protein